jgi:hypothetical protein
MDSMIADLPSKTVRAVAISACVLARPGACSAALKGVREMFSYIQATASHVERFEGNLKPPITMMRSDPPPNFWERECADMSARLDIITSVCSAYADQIGAAGHKACS